MSRIYYFGCLKEHGHFLWTQHGERMLDTNPVLRELGFPLQIEVLDGGLMPIRKTYAPEGLAYLSHVNDWTIISFNDNSVDSRPNSHSAFIIEGVLSFGVALKAARMAFPDIFQRFNFEVRLSADCFVQSARV